MSQGISRRYFLHLGVVGASAALLAACQPQVVKETVVVEKEVEKVVTKEVEKVVKETVVGEAKPAGPEVKTLTTWLSVELNPTEWTVPSAAHPIVQNASRILARRFEEMHPEVKINFATMPVHGERTTDYTQWLTPLVAAGNAPELVGCVHHIPIQNGWAMPINEYLDQPNPYAPEYPRWRDIFYPVYMNTLKYADGREYCAPLGALWPNLQVGLVYNKELFDKYGLKPPKTWTEEKEVSRELKNRGDGLSPWWREGKSGNLWPLALQILPPMMQKLCVDMDTDGDRAVGIAEALAAHRKGLIGPKTPIYRRGFYEMYELSRSWVEGFLTTDLDLLFRQGGVALQYRGLSEFASLANDPNIKFERGYLPTPMPNSEDIPPTADQPGAYDPAGWTEGDGTVPADLVKAEQGPDIVLLGDQAKKHNNLEENLKWWQWLTIPENDAFLINELQTRIPAAKDAPLGPVWREISYIKLPVYDYAIVWWGLGFYWDATNFMNWRKVFLEWATDQIDEQTHFDRQEQEFAEGAERYAKAEEERQKKQ